MPETVARAARRARRRDRLTSGEDVQPYGVDAGFRDVSGNHMRMIQRNG